jgi:hypothetical protein
MGVKSLLERLKAGQTGPLQEPQGCITCTTPRGSGIGVSSYLGLSGLQRLQELSETPKLSGSINAAMNHKLLPVKEIRQNTSTQ